MGYTVLYEDIIFDEGTRNDVTIIKPINADLSFKIGAQLKSLRDVKSILASNAKSLGANCIINFTYGQKSRLLAIDNVAYFGKGIACKLTPNDYSLIIQNLKTK